MVWLSLQLVMATVLVVKSAAWIVDTTTGKVEGKRTQAANGKSVDMFWGIPYAEPPLGDLRFRSPKPIKR